MMAEEEEVADASKYNNNNSEQQTTAITIITGCCPLGSNVVYWKYSTSSSEEETACSLPRTNNIIARRRKQDGSSSLSVVQFTKDGPIQFLNIVNSIDVACILLAFQQQERFFLEYDDEQDHQSFIIRKKQNNNNNNYKLQPTTTTVDRKVVQNAIKRGDLPTIVPGSSILQQWVLKVCMNAFFWRPTVEFFSAGPYRYASRCYYNVQKYPHVKGHIALTIDDAPCRNIHNNNIHNSMVPNVLDVLEQYNESHATFMVVGSYLQPIHEPHMIQLLQAGHELGNHGMVDRRYDDTDDISSSLFANHVDACTERIQDLHIKAGITNQQQQQQSNNVPLYFRAPHGKYTKAMERVLQERGMTNIMCDTYASCPRVQDGQYIGQLLGQRAQHGSIILLHMPEHGFREWCFTALQQLLHILVEERGMSVVTVRQLHNLAEKK